MQRDKVYFDEGEKRHVKIKVCPTDGNDYPFKIRNPRFKLLKGETVEAEGACIIEDNILDAFIEPQELGTYDLIYIYEIADETWVDIFKLRVSG